MAIHAINPRPLERQPCPPVVNAGRYMEENMRKTLLTSVAAVALVAGSTLGFAQGMNKGGEAPAAAPSAGAPSSSAPAEKSAPTTRGQGAEHQAPSGSMKGGQAE